MEYDSKYRNKSGIYAIVNQQNGKMYIGSATNILKRWSVHYCQLVNNKHFNTPLQRAWNKYGEGAFDWVVLELCSKQQLVANEQRWIDSREFNKLYNVLRIAGSALGRRHSDDTIQKLRKAAKSRCADPEYRSMLSDRAKRMHQDGRIPYRRLELNRVCKSCGVVFERPLLTNGKRHDTHKCMDCKINHFVHCGGQFNLDNYVLTDDEFDNYAFDLTYTRLPKYKPKQGYVHQLQQS